MYQRAHLWANHGCTTMLLPYAGMQPPTDCTDWHYADNTYRKPEQPWPWMSNPLGLLYDGWSGDIVVFSLLSPLESEYPIVLHHSSILTLVNSYLSIETTTTSTSTSTNLERSASGF